MSDTKPKIEKNSKIEELLKQKQKQQFNTSNNLSFKSARPTSVFRTQNRGGK